MEADRVETYGWYWMHCIFLLSNVSKNKCIFHNIVCSFNPRCACSGSYHLPTTNGRMKERRHIIEIKLNHRKIHMILDYKTKNMSKKQKIKHDQVTRWKDA